MSIKVNTQIKVKNSSGTYIGEFHEFIDLEYGFERINNVGIAKFKVPKDSPKLAELIGDNQRKNSIHIWRNGVEVWAGELVNVEGKLTAQGDDFVWIEAKSWLELLNHRYTDDVVTYENKNIAYIVKDLIQQSQALTDGDYGFTFGQGLSEAETGWYGEDWSHRIQVDIDANQVEDDFTDFVVQIDLSLFPATFWSNAKADGGDLVATEMDGLTPLSSVLISIDTTAEKGDLYIKIPTLSSSTDTSFFLYFGNAAGAETNDTSGTFSDEWLAAYPMTKVGNTRFSYDMARNAADSEMRGNALRLGDGTSNTDAYISNTAVNIFNGDEFTVEIALRPDFDWDDGQSHLFMDSGNSSADNRVMLFKSSSNELQYSIRFPISAFVALIDATPANWGFWDKENGFHIALRIDYTGQKVALFINGEKINEVVDTSGNGNPTGYFVGSNRTGSSNFVGDIYWFRVFKILLTDDEHLALARGERFLRPIDETTDTFTEATDTELASHTPDVGTGWTKAIEVGTASMEVNAADDDLRDATGGSSDGVLYVTDDSSEKSSCEVEVDVVSDSAFVTRPWYLVGRYQDTNNFYAAEFYRDQCKIWKKESGTWTEIASKTEDNVAAEGNRLRFVVFNDSLQIWKNGYPVLYGQDSAITAAGQAGIGVGALRDSGQDMGGWHFDNFNFRGIDPAAWTSTDYVEVINAFNDGSGTTIESINQSDATLNGSDYAWVDRRPYMETPNGLNYFTTNFRYDERLRLPNTILDEREEVTFEFLYRTQGRFKSTYNYIFWITAANSTTDNELLVGWDWRSSGTFHFRLQGTLYKPAYTKPVEDNAYHVMTIVYSVSENRFRIYIDGVEEAELTPSPVLGALTVDVGGLYLAAEQDSVGGGFGRTQIFSGDIDFFSVSNEVRSDNWIQTRVNNMLRPDLFISTSFISTQNATTQYAKTISKEFESKNIMEILVELAQIDGGPDIEITHDKVINLYPQMGEDKSTGTNKLLVQWGHNVASIDRITKDFNNPVNEVVVKGAGFGSSQTTATVTDVANRSSHKLRQAKLVIADEKDSNLLVDFGNAFLDRMGQPITNVEFTFVPGMAPGFDDLQMGDTFQLLASDGFWDISLTFRVIGWLNEIADNSTEITIFELGIQQ